MKAFEVGDKVKVRDFEKLDGCSGYSKTPHKFEVSLLRQFEGLTGTILKIGNPFIKVAFTEHPFDLYPFELEYTKPNLEDLYS